ncbi:hypothetical protein B0H13DRAFT_1700095 [Mycena leptocephala]|nr:hypothetical protein B0H13DRAFT_1700095 [Mycena leptocephala]
MSSPPAKRQRTEDAPITRSDIWHRDGSVVLQAENTQFRVHWGVLALHSPFFRDMQELPQPPDQPSVDGCPIVELQDTTVDVEHLLNALYNPILLLQKALPFPLVAALIRLGRKYDFRDLRNTVMERFTYENPTTVRGYIALLDGNRKYKTTRILNYPGVIYDMLTVARENNIQSCLPCAYYRAVQFHTLENLFDGISRGDGTSAFLAPLDQRRCVMGRDFLLKAQGQPGYSQGWLCSWNGNDDNCANLHKCTRVRSKSLKHYLKYFDVQAFKFLDPSELCNSCYQHCWKLYVEGKKKLWEDMPSFFDLPPWAELTNDL